MKIEPTGYCAGGFLFKNLILTQQEYSQVTDLKKLAEQHQVDFICVEREGEVNYIHLTDVENVDFIEQNGLKKKDVVSDLGIGIYVVDKNNYEGIDNLKTYFEDYEKDEIVVVTGFYVGKYLECVYGYGHVGYIVINTDKIEYNDIDIIKIEDFLFEYWYRGGTKDG